MIDHQAAILHDFNSGAGEALGGAVVADARLEPDRFRFRGEDVFEVRVDVFGAARVISDR